MKTLQNILEDRFETNDFNSLSSSDSFRQDRLTLEVYDELKTLLEPGKVMLVASRPSVGKTTLALRMIEDVALRSKGSVVMFSLELCANSIAGILMECHKPVDGRIGNIDEQSNSLENLSLLIDDSPTLTVTDIALILKIYSGIIQLECVVIDYVQLLKDYSLSSPEQIEKVFSSIKSIAIDLVVPIVVLSQISRNADKRKGERPMPIDVWGWNVAKEHIQTLVLLYSGDASNNLLGCQITKQ